MFNWDPGIKFTMHYEGASEVLNRLVISCTSYADEKTDKEKNKSKEMSKLACDKSSVNTKGYISRISSME